jgi:hypothetical protein
MGCAQSEDGNGIVQIDELTSSTVCDFDEAWPSEEAAQLLYDGKPLRIGTLEEPRPLVLGQNPTRARNNPLVESNPR